MLAFVFTVFSLLFVFLMLCKIRTDVIKGKRALAATERWCDASAALTKALLSDNFDCNEELLARYLEAARKFYETHPYLTHGFKDDPVVKFCQKFEVEIDK